MTTSRETYLRGVGYEIIPPDIAPDPRANPRGYIEWSTQEDIIALVRIFGREIAREKVANMLLIAFKETGR